jgi:hypothetical protein
VFVSLQLSPTEELCNRPRPRRVQENGAKQFPEFSREFQVSKNWARIQ